MNRRLTPAGEPQPRYLELSERAVDHVSRHAEGVTELELARVLFGPVAGDRWTGLLATILGNEPRLTRRDGHWVRADTSAAHTAPLAEPLPDHDGLPWAADINPLGDLDTITTLALATTGADPRRHRIVRVVIVQRAAGAIVEQFDAVVQPIRRLSRFVLDAARLVEDDLDAAPTFAEIVPNLREVMTHGRIYAYGAARARAFVTAECHRAGLPPPAMMFCELDDLLGAELGPERKPGLRAAAQALGIPYPERRSPLADADTAGRIIERLRERQAASPPRASVVLDASPSRGASDAPTATPLPFTSAWATGAPEGPGVYIVEDAQGLALYIGKAAALRRRLAAYVQRQPSFHRQLEALGVRAVRVTTIETPSDLEATVLEARLIRERRPAFNVARQTRPPAVIVRAAPDAPSPRVQLVSVTSSNDPDGARYFGPFESVRAARQVLRVARAAFPDAFARRRGDVSRQRAAVLEVCRLLSGQKEPARQSLQAAMRAAAAAGDVAAVDRLRADLRDVQTLDIRPSILVGLAAGWRLCVVERLADGRRRGHRLLDGRLVASCDLGRADAWLAPAVATDHSFPQGGHHALPDRAQQPPALTSSGCGCTLFPSDWDTGNPSPAPSSPPTDQPDTDGTVATADPDERAIVLRWLTQARGRVTVHRMAAD